MGKNVNYKEFEQFVKKMNKTFDEQAKNDFMEKCVKELAARLLSRVIKRTPVKEGTLRRGWTAGQENTSEKGNVIGVSGKNGFANQMEVKKVGDEYQITVSNSVEYASYVEYGHRRAPGYFIPEYGKSTTEGWTDGKFMLTISEKEVNSLAPALLEKRLMEYLKEAMK